MPLELGTNDRFEANRPVGRDLIESPRNPDSSGIPGAIPRKSEFPARIGRSRLRSATGTIFLRQLGKTIPYRRVTSRTSGRVMGG